MRRRDFIKSIVGATIAGPLAAQAQEPGRTYRLGNLHTAPRDASHHIALLDELRHAGFIEGNNLAIDKDGYGLHPEQFAEHAAKLVARGIDVIQAGGDAAVRAAQRATSTIPIIALTDDMLGQGFVRSLAKPGGNTTGVSIFASELDDKRQEILVEFLPGIQRVAALVDTNTTPQRGLDRLQRAALALDVALSIHRVARSPILDPRSTLQRLPMPTLSTFWHRRSFSTIVGLFLSASIGCAFPPSTSGRRWLKREVFWPMARASFNSTAT